MKTIRAHVFAALYIGLCSSSVFAQSTPLQTGPILPAPAAESTQVLLDKINRSLNSMTTLIGDFSQISADGRRRSGKLYVQRPGKLRFDYNPPSQLEVVADGSSVAVIDKRVPQQDIYGINQTPLKFLVGERIDIAKDTKVISVRREKDDVVLDIEDKNTIAGTSKIRIYFNGESFQLKRWVVTDPQGVPTTVNLANLNTQQRPDKGLFFINYQFNVGRGQAN
jgi:outer membrane lipoprotein-sorting protein